MSYSREFSRRRMIEEFKYLELLEQLGKTEEYQKQLTIMRGRDPQPTAGDKGFAFVGINPPAGSVTLKELYDFCVAHYPYKGYTMCVEQNTPDEGVRPHLHILHPVTGNTRKNHIISRLAKLFKVEENYIDVKVSKSNPVISRWGAYLRGEKKGEKIEYVEKDIKDRDIYNIPHIYNGSS